MCVGGLFLFHHDIIFPNVHVALCVLFSLAFFFVPVALYAD